MHYVVTDSMIYMREKPVIWADNSQLSGDSINVKIKKEAIEKLLMYPNAFVIQEDSISGFNQVKGKQITAFFKENELNNMFNEGNAETIYWLRDDDGSLIGINFSQSSQMDIIIKNRQISNIKYYKNIKETLYPLEQLNDNQEFLDGFSWQEETRPRREEFDF